MALPSSKLGDLCPQDSYALGEGGQHLPESLLQCGQLELKLAGVAAERFGPGLTAPGTVTFDAEHLGDLHRPLLRVNSAVPVQMRLRVPRLPRCQELQSALQDLNLYLGNTDTALDGVK